MDSGFIIGGLAAFTLGSILLLALLQAKSFLRDPKNRFHMQNVFSRDGHSATATAEALAPAGASIPLKERLDNSIASSHPAEPGKPTAAARVAKLNAEKSA